jgi:hypothetical protein
MKKPCWHVNEKNEKGGKEGKNEEKKRPNIFASRGRGNPGPLPSIRTRDDIKNLQTLNTFRHQTPALVGGRARSLVLGLLKEYQ